jgi:hypothetical protein
MEARRLKAKEYFTATVLTHESYQSKPVNTRETNTFKSDFLHDSVPKPISKNV